MQKIDELKNGSEKKNSRCAKIKEACQTCAWAEWDKVALGVFFPSGWDLMDCNALVLNFDMKSTKKK